MTNGQANTVRLKMLEVMHRSRASHIGSCLSVIDILLAVYDSIDIDKIRNKASDRDRVIVSKGHGAAALYTVLNHFKIISDDDLDSYYSNDTRLGGHVTSSVNGVEHSTGALGHGLSVATGISLGLKVRKMNSKVFVVVGDGEMHEGSNWEAILSASHLCLNNLVLFVDYNKLSGIGKTNDSCNLEPVKSRLEAFGFMTYEVDGHDYTAIRKVLEQAGEIAQPSAVICHTVKGKGISFMENNNVWHYRPLNDEDYAKAIQELK